MERESIEWWLEISQGDTNPRRTLYSQLTINQFFLNKCSRLHGASWMLDCTIVYYCHIIKVPQNWF